MTAPARRLTDRQLEIIDRMTRPGATGKRVADDLGVTERTISNHLAHAYREYGVRTLAQLVRVLLLHRGRPSD